MEIKGWRAEEARKGWEIYIGKFRMEDTWLEVFRRYTAHHTGKRLHEISGDTQEIAETYGLKCSSIVKTMDSCYNYLKFYQIFLIKAGANTINKDLEKIQRIPAKPFEDLGSIALAFHEKVPYNKNNSCIIDVNALVKPIHRGLIENIDDILFPKIP